ncbi:MAG: YkgJ family cysteine cluster protein [Geobacteraceae bacterium]|nr:YkgJ family cysteine cluster protein [Geobacteraceae bacterium]
MKQSLDIVLNRYGTLLSSVDEWFERSVRFAGKRVVCGRGCSSCCRGLFDITLLDAVYLKEGFDRLPADVRLPILEKAEKRCAHLQSVWPDFSPPYILNLRSEEEWDALMPEDDETPCPLVGEDGGCRAYRHRPMTCRLHGLPLIDKSGEMFHDEWCTMNFPGEDPLVLEEIRWEFRKCFQEELGLFQQCTDVLLGQRIRELDTVIPAALLMDYRDFDWTVWWRESSGRIRAAGSQDSC